MSRDRPSDEPGDAGHLLGVRGLDAFLGDRGMPRSVGLLHREHLEACISDLLERWKPATAQRRSAPCL